MKVRFGFVSNSSSSSFLIIGTKKEHIVKSVAEKMGKYDPSSDEFTVELDYGVGTIDDRSGLNFYGGYEPTYIGIDVSKRIRVTPYEELRKEFLKVVEKNFAIDVPLPSVDLYYGECGDG